MRRITKNSFPHLLLLSIFAFSACGEEESTQNTEPELTARDPMLLKDAKDGDFVQYASRTPNTGVVGEISATSFGEPIAESLRISMRLPSDSPVYPDLSRGGSTGGMDRAVSWLRDLFADSSEAEILSTTPGEINLFGHRFQGQIHTVANADGSTLIFELTPSLPAGGLARVTYQSGDQKVILLEAIAHTPTADAPILKPLKIRNDRPQVNYAFDGSAELLAWLSVDEFLQAWMEAGQPERDYPFEEPFEALLATGLIGENTAAEGSPAAKGARERLTQTKEKITDYQLLGAINDGGNRYLVGVNFILESGTEVPATLLLMTKGKKDGSTGFRIWDIYHTEKGPGVRETLAQP